VVFSAVDPASVVNVVKKGMAGKVNFVLMDSDSPKSGRPLYIGLNIYNGGVLAAKAMLTALNNGANCGKVIGFVVSLPRKTLLTVSRASRIRSREPNAR
jgi:ABC-type sugar transport system substrate-binding protein